MKLTLLTVVALCSLAVTIGLEITYTVYSDDACKTESTSIVASAGDCVKDPNFNYSGLLTAVGDLVIDNFYQGGECKGDKGLAYFGRGKCMTKGDGTTYTIDYTPETANLKDLTITQYSDTLCKTESNVIQGKEGQCVTAGPVSAYLVITDGEVLDVYFGNTDCEGEGASTIIPLDTCTKTGDTTSVKITSDSATLVMAWSTVMFAVAMLLL